jgi:hypothetical protein
MEAKTTEANKINLAFNVIAVILKIKGDTLKQDYELTRDNLIKTGALLTYFDYANTLYENNQDLLNSKNIDKIFFIKTIADKLNDIISTEDTEKK